MKAVVARGARQLAVEEVPNPEPGPGQALLRVQACGICGTDLHLYRAGLWPPGAIPGHEFAGELVEDAGGLRAGERFCAIPTLSCGSCRRCASGLSAYCTHNSLAMGLGPAPGALAEQVVDWARPLLDVDLPEPAESLDELAQLLRDRVGVLATAVDSLDPARLAGGLTAGLDPAVAFIAGVREAVEQVVVTVRSAIASVGTLVDAIDLSPITDAIQAVIEPVAEVIDTITSLIGDAQATIETASAAVTSDSRSPAARLPTGPA